MCLFVITSYSCGHCTTRTVYFHTRCRKVRCPGTKTTDVIIGDSCSDCKRYTLDARDISVYFNCLNDSSGGSGDDFNPFFGQGGYEDEATYHARALIAFRRKQDLERARAPWAAQNTTPPHEKYCYCELCEIDKRLAKSNNALKVFNALRRSGGGAGEPEK